MRKMERALVLQLLDTAWKDHLLAMDHLRSSVGLRGYAQIDPKVEYKREGHADLRADVGLGGRADDRPDLPHGAARRGLRRLDLDGGGGHPPGRPIGQRDRRRSSRRPSRAREVDHKPQPIRNRQQRVGRNDPCPCGSGKKFKQCCMKKG